MTARNIHPSGFAGRGDDVYAALLEAHEGLSEADSHALIGLEPGAACVARRIDVAQVGHAGRRHLLGQPLQVERAELVPLGQDHDQIGVLRGLVGIVAIARRAAAPRPRAALAGRPRAPSRHRPRAPARWSATGRIAHVVGVGFERHAQNRDGLAVEAARRKGRAASRSSALDALVHADDRLDDAACGTACSCPIRAKALVSLGKHEPP
jgi:hypothetical protein